MKQYIKYSKSVNLARLLALVILAITYLTYVYAYGVPFTFVKNVKLLSFPFVNNSLNEVS